MCTSRPEWHEIPGARNLRWTQYYVVQAYISIIYMRQFAIKILVIVPGVQSVGIILVVTSTCLGSQRSSS